MPQRAVRAAEALAGAESSSGPINLELATMAGASGGSSLRGLLIPASTIARELRCPVCKFVPPLGSLFSIFPPVDGGQLASHVGPQVSALLLL
jgi:hypothetical protein